MSNYKGHIVGGIIAWGLLASIATHFGAHPSPFTIIEWGLFCVLGALFPDVDIKSKGQKIFYWILTLVCIVLVFKGYFELIAILLLVAVVPLLVRHRGIFHRLWFVILVPAGCAMLACSYLPASCMSIVRNDTLFFICGAISHLWLDFGLKRMLGL